MKKYVLVWISAIITAAVLMTCLSRGFDIKLGPGLKTVIASGFSAIAGIICGIMKKVEGKVQRASKEIEDKNGIRKEPLKEDVKEVQTTKNFCWQKISDSPYNERLDIEDISTRILIVNGAETLVIVKKSSGTLFRIKYHSIKTIAISKATYHENTLEVGYIFIELKNGAKTQVKWNNINAPYNLNYEYIRRIFADIGFMPKESEPDRKNEIKLIKTKACMICLKQGIYISDTVTFASSNNSYEGKYWANPSVKVLDNDWTLILNDNKRKKIHVFKIPKGSIRLEQLKRRKDNNLIDLQIYYDDVCFEDSRSHIAFRNWHTKTIEYSNYL